MREYIYNEKGELTHSYTIAPNEPDLESLTNERLAQLIADAWFLKILIRYGLHKWGGAKDCIESFENDWCLAEYMPFFSGGREFNDKVNAHIEKTKTKVASEAGEGFVAIEKNELEGLRKSLRQAEDITHMLRMNGIEKWSGYEKSLKDMETLYEEWRLI